MNNRPCADAKNGFVPLGGMRAGKRDGPPMIPAFNEVESPIELGGLAINDTGGLTRRAPKLPLTFGFTWRKMGFTGQITRTGERLVLRLAADVAVVPFSAENTGKRRQLLSLLQIGGTGGTMLSLMLSPSNTLILLREIVLAPDAGLTADTLVTMTATSVLESAPHLDLMAQYGFV